MAGWRESDEAVWRRRATSRETSKRVMDFSIPPPKATPMPTPTAKSKTATPASIRSVLEAADDTSFARPSTIKRSDKHSMTTPRLSSSKLTPATGAKRTDAAKKKKYTPSVKSKSSRTPTAMAARAETPASGKTNRSRSKLLSTKKKAPQPPRKRHRKIGESDDDDDEDADVMRRTVKIRPVGVSTRRPNSLVDIDIVLDTMERCVREHITTVYGKPLRRLLVDFYQECDIVGREYIEMLEEQRILQAALRSAESQKKELRKELLDIHRGRAEVRKGLQEAEDEHHSEEQRRKDLDDAHALLCDVDLMCASAKQEQKKKETESPIVNTSLVKLKSMIQNLNSVTTSIPSLELTNARLQRFLEIQE